MGKPGSAVKTRIKGSNPVAPFLLSSIVPRPEITPPFEIKKQKAQPFPGASGTSPPTRFIFRSAEGQNRTDIPGRGELQRHAPQQGDPSA